MFREIEEAVAFVAAYFYYRLPRSQVDLFAVEFANTLLNECRLLNAATMKNAIRKAGEWYQSKASSSSVYPPLSLDFTSPVAPVRFHSAGDKQQHCSGDRPIAREIVVDINMGGKLAVAIVQAANIFDVPLQQISALLPNAVQLHISDGMVCYNVRSKFICLYRSDGNMYHIHRRAHHTHMRPPLTLTEGDLDTKIFKLIGKDTFPRRRKYARRVFERRLDDMPAKSIRRVMKSDYFRCNNQQLPGPTRSAKLSGNGFMHPSLPPSSGRKWRSLIKAIDCTRNRTEQTTGWPKPALPEANKVSTIRKDSVRSIKRRQRNPGVQQQQKAFVTDDMLRSFGVLANDHLQCANPLRTKDVHSLVASMNYSLKI